MCFSLQRRVIFPHPGFKKMVRTRQFFNIFTCKCASRYSGVQFFHIRASKKCPEPVSFLTFWLTNVLLATAACNFSTSGLQKVVRTCSALYILTYKCTSRYSGVQFFICPPNSYLRTRRFTEVTFRPSRPTNHWKNSAIRDLPIFFLLTFAQLYLLSFDSTSLLCFSSCDSASLLCFFNCPYCRKLDF